LQFCSCRKRERLRKWELLANDKLVDADLDDDVVFRKGWQLRPVG
jgi:hypothetical protein